MKIVYSEIIELALNSSNQYATELESQLKGLIKIDSIFIAETRRIYEIYFTRFNVQKNDIQKKIVGWETLISKLEKIAQNTDSQIKLTHITCEEFAYLFFSSKNNKEFYGVLKFMNLKIIRSVELDKNNNLIGTWNETIFFLNGKEISN